MSDHGKFVWCELMTTDTAAAATFYGTVAGWTHRIFAGSDNAYLIVETEQGGVGGIMGLPPGARPAWLAYIAVDDVDAATARIADLGGTVHKPAADIPTIGRFAVVADPQGAVFTVFKPIPPENPPAAANPMAPGQISWRELHATDWQKAFAFYADLFGWTKGEPIDMGPMGTYQIFCIDGAMAGGMMTKSDPRPPSWLNYVNVAGIDAAAGRVKEAGGEIVTEPQEVPGGAWIIHARDPQGVVFAAVGPRG